MAQAPSIIAPRSSARWAISLLVTVVESGWEIKPTHIATYTKCHAHEEKTANSVSDFVLGTNGECLACRKAHDMQIVHEKEEKVAIEAETNMDPDWFKDNSKGRKPRR